jgi:hypothetical protein
MRDKLIIVLLSVCCTLLAVNLIAVWNDAAPVVHGQGGGGEAGGYILATSATQNEPICFIFKADTKHLAAYMARTGGGIRVLGVRNSTFDFNHEEVVKHFSVSQARKAQTE